MYRNSTHRYKKDDDYETPDNAWDLIKDYIPKDKVIWESFYATGKSGEYLRKMGFEVIHNDEDFFENNRGDICVSNPPFTIKKEVLQRLKELDKPFILLMPQQTINAKYFMDMFREENIQLLIPPKRIHFIKNGDDKTKCSFDCAFFCWKMGYDKDLIFLNKI